MPTVSTPPVEEARSIFTDLGYTVSGDEGSEFRADRKWRSVRVTALAESDETPDDGDMRCFVTWDDHAPELRRKLRRLDPTYEWAVIGVRECGDYEVARAPPSAAPAV